MKPKTTPKTAKKPKELIAGLPASVKFYPEGNGYRFLLGKRFTGGKVQKKRFDTVKDAREWFFGSAEKLKGDGEAQRAAVPAVAEQKTEAGASGFELSPRQVAEAAAAMKLFAGRSTLTEAAEAVKLLDGRATLTEAVKYFIAHRLLDTEKTVADASTAYVKAKETLGKSEKHLKGLRSVFKAFCARFGEKKLYEMRREAVEEWLAGLPLSPKTKGNYVRDLKSLFEECTRRNWLASNPLEHAEKPTVPPSEIQILEPDTVKKLLNTARKHAPELLASLAIKIFAGLRTSELLALDWEDIHTEEAEISIRAINTKTRRHRLVSISDNLAAWLTLARKKGGKGKVYQGKSQNTYHAAIEKLAPLAEITIPDNAFRHSFGSYLYALKKDENHVASQMGNSPDVIFAHYRRPIPASKVTGFWAIDPAKCEEVS